MTGEEFSRFAMTLKTFFPKEQLIPNKEAMELWYQMLQDIDYKIAITFLQKWIATEKWSPSIAEIRQGCAELQDAPLPDWGSGWYEVIKAIGRYGYMQEEKALASMSPVTRQVVERLGWTQLCRSENEVADRANFRSCYETLVKREHDDRQIPAQLKGIIDHFRIGAESERKMINASME